MAELKFEITERIGVLSENAKGWTKELNKVSWNEREPKYDLREERTGNTHEKNRNHRCHGAGSGNSQGYSQR